jgi:hypothetical protein
MGKKLINYRESSKIDVKKMVYGSRIKQSENGMKGNARKCHMQQKKLKEKRNERCKNKIKTTKEERNERKFD